MNHCPRHRPADPVRTGQTDRPGWRGGRIRASLAVDFDVYLIDEVIAAGDQGSKFAAMQELFKSALIGLDRRLPSPEIVKSYCSRALRTASRGAKSSMTSVSRSTSTACSKPGRTAALPALDCTCSRRRSVPASQSTQGMPCQKCISRRSGTGVGVGGVFLGSRAGTTRQMAGRIFYDGLDLSADAGEGVATYSAYAHQGR